MRPCLKSIALFVPFAALLVFMLVSFAVTIAAIAPRLAELFTTYKQDVPALLGAIALMALVAFLLREL